MWIVRIALERPYTFLVLAIMLLIVGPLTILRTAIDIFPVIDIPVVAVVWGYSGLPADEIATRLTGQFERTLTTTVNDIEHTESQSMNGISVIKIFFQPNVKIAMAVAQVTAIGQTALRGMPPGTLPPLILSYNAATVPVIQLGLTSNKLDEQQLFNQVQNFMRPIITTVAGAASPYPYGGRTPQIQVDLDQQMLRSLGITAADVSSAISSQNLIIPAGTEKIGDTEYNVRLNSSPLTVDELNDLPIKRVNGRTIFVRDVAHVRNGSGPQTNIVRLDGVRGVLSSIVKTGGASTLDVIQGVKDRLDYVKAILPPDITFRAIGDQSVFVQAAVNGVLFEGAIAATLTGLLILLFLGNWRSTLIITVSIPLSILASIITLAAFGQTINIMTLGGLALAVGILVDDATVAVESVNHHLEQGKDVREAILDGAQQIAVPALVSTLAICIVFVPMFLLSGVARFLFVPLAEAVVFAMLASYVLSRTLVPTLAMYWLKPIDKDAPRAPKTFLGRFQQGFETRFEEFRAGYRQTLEASLGRPWRVIAVIALGVLVSGGLVPFLGEDFFPTVDGGQVRLHIRAPAGTRVEETSALAARIEQRVRELFDGEVSSVVSNVGLPVSAINLAYSNSGFAGEQDGDLLISLNPGHTPVAKLVEQLRADLPLRFPGVQVASLPADMVGQILNYGLPAPIDVQVTGPDVAALRQVATRLYEQLRTVPGLADLRIQQPAGAPEFNIAVDRSRALELGLQQRDVASSMLISLSGSFQTEPAFWLDRDHGVSYPIVIQSPQRTLQSVDDLREVPLGGDTAGTVLGGLGTIRRGASPSLVSHYNAQSVIDLYAGVRGTDLGSIDRAIQRAIGTVSADMPKSIRISVRGQVETMNSSFIGLGAGVLFAAVLVYLLIVVNFQSWLDPLIIISALPTALAGIVWMLFLSHTTVSVPALMGTLMTIGVATANSILVVSFARERVDQHGDDGLAAAIEAGAVRLRPVLMTALAMVIGMVPMALGLGEGGEQNAPLGRAVIGGLLFATPATLFLVPAVFALMHRRRA